MLLLPPSMPLSHGGGWMDDEGCRRICIGCVIGCVIGWVIRCVERVY